MNPSWLSEIRALHDEIGQYVEDYRKAPQPETKNGDLLTRRLASATMTELLERVQDLRDEIVRRRDIGSCKRPAWSPGWTSLGTTLIREGFSPERNLARHRLSALPVMWLKSLCNGVHMEVSRRFPELNEETRSFLSMTALIVDFPFPPTVSTPAKHTDGKSKRDEDLQSQFDELSEYVVGDEEQPERGETKMRLAGLSVPQFDELVTDVLDEVVRRKYRVQECDFLPPEAAMHPMRNEARKKLSGLDSSLRDLASDVHFEMCRRYLSSEDLVQELLVPL